MRRPTVFGPGLERPSLSEIAAHITNTSCREGDCPRLGKPCDGCRDPFCVEHLESYKGEELCAYCLAEAEKEYPSYPSEQGRGVA